MKVFIVVGLIVASVAAQETRTGLDVLAKQGFAPLRGKSIGIITNHTGLSYEDKRNIDLMSNAGIKIKAVFSPEHGFLGAEDQMNVKDSRDAKTGLPIVSLFQGNTQRITPKMLEGIDILVYDIQDVGARFYTYSCTLLSSMEEASKAHIPFYILDRPNPVTGTHVEGPMLDEDLHSFVGCAAIPVRHGMTFGELAQMVNGERKIGADVHVVKMTGWKRSEWYDATNQTWIDPSPAINSLAAATIYTGLCLLEYSKNYSIGRGTLAPFEQVGADWIVGRDLAAYLNSRAIPGIRVYPIRFRPSANRFKDQWIEGVRFEIVNRDAINAIRLGLEIATALEKLYPGKIDFNANARLIGSKAVIAALQAHKDPAAIEQSYRADLDKFLQVRQKYLLYQ